MLQQMRGGAKYIWLAIFVFFVVGFLLYQTSGLSTRSANTTSTVVASVNGEKIVLATWQAQLSRREQEAQQRAGRALTLDEQKRLEQETFDEMVQQILLDQEFKKRGIRVADKEIIDAAQTSPPPELMQAPELQTDGHFDIEKYQRYLSSPMAKSQGLLAGLEQMYRTEIPREKLFNQVATSVFVSDAQLWNLWRDTHDSAQISFTFWQPNAPSGSSAPVSDADIKAYYDAHKTDLTRKGHAMVSLVVIPRAVTAADSAAVRTHILAIRDSVTSGKAKFEDIAKGESQDSASAVQGGSLGTVARGQFVPSFDSAAFALKPGEMSGAVRTPFGYHLIRVDAKKGDSITVRHILLKIQQSDSAAARTNARADSLEKMAGQADLPAAFDKAAATLGLAVLHVPVTEDQPVIMNGQEVPSVGTWVFSGAASVGESSELFEVDDAYYLARLDSLTPGGVPTLAQATPSIRLVLQRQAALKALQPAAAAFATAAAATSLEAEATATHGHVAKSPEFTRTSFVPDVGRMNEVIGAAFALPVGVVSQPIMTRDAIFVIRVDKRVVADRATWEKQKDAQRQQIVQALRQQAVRDFIDDLKTTAKITDHRKEIEAANRKAAAAA
ncbi:MAG TPA: peptidyl-prolyl cis-trans isomerase [Gemmatimonadaceae bacterium]|nr:peptidyl-prolyl cis-trans isomerase [Gemmatimonadaceae bacterium]